MNDRVISELVTTCARNYAGMQIDQYGRCFSDLEVQCIISESQYRLLGIVKHHRILSIVEKIFKKWEALLKSETK